MSPSPPAPEEGPLEAVFEQAVSGSLPLSEFAASLRGGSLFMLAQADPAEAEGKIVRPLAVLNGAGTRMVAAFTSTARAWEWRDPSYPFAVYLDGALILQGISADVGLAINVGSVASIEIAPAGVSRLQSGQDVESSDIRVKAASLLPRT